MKGKIIKGIAGFYEVESGGELVTCKAKGIFRKDGIKPLVGDMVEFAAAETRDSEANIVKILPRKNMLIRPAVSNVDLALVVLSVRKPDPELYLLDRYLVTMAQQGIPAAILWNKMDLDCDDRLPEYAEVYRKAGYRTLSSSTVDGRGIPELRAFLAGKTTVFAGPSGVGKSSLTNLLCPDAGMETGEISRRIERGKQTTRHTQLFFLGEETYLLDTPGFTSVFVEGTRESELGQYFPEMVRLSGQCRFTGCRHLSEPDCKVKEAVENGSIAASRYESYRKMTEELSEKRKYG